MEMVATIANPTAAKGPRYRSKITEEFHASERRRKEKAVVLYISNYFAEVDIPLGVDIRSKKYIDLCIDANICDAVDSAYKMLKSGGRFQHCCGDGTMSEDVRFVITILKRIRQRCVPQEFSAGMLLMHLELLEGLPSSNAI